MTAFDDLEAQLRRATAAGCPKPAPRSSRRDRRLRIGIGAFLVAGIMGGGALAADQVLELGDPVRETPGTTEAPAGPGPVVASTARVLPMRVEDPTGGPPWALRTFQARRGAACVQLGRVQEGRFGTVEPRPGADGRQVFRPLPATTGAGVVRCGTRRAAGYPVVRGLRLVESRGGRRAPPTCGGRRCPVSDARVIRFGLLGPAAIAAQFVDGSGPRGPTQSIPAGSGGAYLFVIAGGEQALEAADRVSAAFEREVAAARRDGLSGREALRHASRDRSVRSRRARMTMRISDAIVATFRDGTRMRVAGADRDRAALPGVPTTERRSRGSVRSRVEITPSRARSTDRPVLAFRSPVAIDRFGAFYKLRTQGPWRYPRCRFKRYGDAFNAIGRDATDGQRLEVPLIASGRKRWCAGTFSVRVELVEGRRSRLVGVGRFTVR